MLTEANRSEETDWSSEQKALYARLQSFSLDCSNAALPFSQRLASEQGWSLDYSQQVIEEYKKFVFLAVVSDHSVTPSDQVDQVWHLHLTYTRAYWDTFCAEILQTSLHHEPTEGGEDESQKFNDWYENTLDSYEQFFKTVPPKEIWPKPSIRFGEDLSFVRVNTARNWMVPKLAMTKFLSAGLVVGTALLLGNYYANNAHSANALTIILFTSCLVAAGLVFLDSVFNTLENLRNPGPVIWPNSRVAGGIGGCGGGGCGSGCGGCGG
ncbi:MAG: hypothetical protein AAFN18_05630 [Cyanobacteria bacterium J06554_6]